MSISGEMSPSTSGAGSTRLRVEVSTRPVPADTLVLRKPTTNAATIVTANSSANDGSLRLAPASRRTSRGRGSAVRGEQSRR